MIINPDHSNQSWIVINIIIITINIIIILISLNIATDIVAIRH